MRYIKDREKLLDGKLSFTPEEVADGKMDRFIAVLRENNCELHIWTDGYAWVVEYLAGTTTADGIQFVPYQYDEEAIVPNECVDWERVDGNK